MSMDKPFNVEVTVDAPRDEVWRALTEPEQIRHWFGWEYDGLDQEIKFIFVDHAALEPPDRIQLGPDGFLELEAVDERRTVVRAIKPGDTTALEWKDVYGDIEEGWITFLNQLRHRFARSPAGVRRMVVLTGKLDALPALSGDSWHSSRFQHGTDVDGALVVVGVKPDGDAMLLVTTYDLSDAAFATIADRWTSWWDGITSK